MPHPVHQLSLPRLSRIAIIDDSEFQLMHLKRTLEKIDDCSVTIFQTLDENALAALQTGFDLFIIDHHMPSISGIELLRWLRSMPATEQTTAVLLTISDSIEVQCEAVNAGATLFQSKPIEPREFRLKVQKLLAAKRVHCRSIA
jgi:putative two-component system response regulator